MAAKPAGEQEHAALHTHLRIEGLTQVDHMKVCEELITKVSEVIGLQLTRATGARLDDSEWAICYRSDGTFSQQVSVQLPSVKALQDLIMHVHGSGVRVAGRNLSVEVRSIHPIAAQGCGAGNLVLDAGGGGQCL